jgi:hypothetical protein
MLRLDAAEQAELARTFQALFADSGFRLQPLNSGDFLLLGPGTAAADASEPARSLGESVTDTMPASGAGERQLRKLGAEIEMWLHDHPVNRARINDGKLPITALWPWGGGPVASRASNQRLLAANNAHESAIAFGRDAYLNGLWSRIPAKVLPLPQQLTGIFSYPHARRVVLVVEISEMLHSNSQWTLPDALARIDSQFIVPAVQALQRGEISRLHILANDYHWALRARDRFKFWRRRRPTLEALR